MYTSSLPSSIRALTYHWLPDPANIRPTHRDPPHATCTPPSTGGECKNQSGSGPTQPTLRYAPSPPPQSRWSIRSPVTSPVQTPFLPLPTSIHIQPHSPPTPTTSGGVYTLRTGSSLSPDKVLPGSLLVNGPLTVSQPTSLSITP